MAHSNTLLQAGVCAVCIYLSIYLHREVGGVSVSVLSIYSSSRGNFPSDYVKCSMDDGAVLLWCIDNVTDLDFNVKHMCLFLSDQIPL